LDPNWDKHGFSDQDDCGAGSGCGGEEEHEPALA
jgi:hypothetical protein